MAEPSPSWFLIVRDRVAGVVDVTEYRHDQATRAWNAYMKAEEDNRSASFKRDAEVVLISAESLADLQNSYPHYFTTGTRDERLKSALRSVFA